MPTLNKVRQGHTARANGIILEKCLVRNSYKEGWHHIPIPMGARQVGGGKLVRVRTPFDFVFVKNKVALFIDAKSTVQNTFPHSRLTVHQIIELKRCEEQGHIAGYIVMFTKIKKTVFFSATALTKLTKKASVSPEDGILIGDDYTVSLNRLIECDTQQRPLLELQT